MTRDSTLKTELHSATQPLSCSEFHKFVKFSQYIKHSTSLVSPVAHVFLMSWILGVHTSELWSCSTVFALLESAGDSDSDSDCTKAAAN